MECETSMLTRETEAQLTHKTIDFHSDKNTCILETRLLTIGDLNLTVYIPKGSIVARDKNFNSHFMIDIMDGTSQSICNVFDC